MNATTTTTATSAAAGSAPPGGAAAANRERLAGVYAAAWPATLRVITAQVRPDDRHIAEDLAQETFLRAWPALHTVREQAATQAWLATLGRRVVARHYRGPAHRPGSRRVVEVPVPPGFSPIFDLPVIDPRTLTTSTAASAEQSAQELERIKRRVDVAAALAGLAGQQRHAVTLRVLDGLPWAEVATRLRRGKTATRRLTEEGLAELRARLTPTYGPPPAPTGAAPAAAAAGVLGQRQGPGGDGQRQADERVWLSALARHALAQPGEPGTGEQRRGHPLAPAGTTTRTGAGSSPGDAEGDARRRVLAAVVAGLPPETRRVVELRFAQGLPVHVVAEQVGRSRQTVHAHTLKALSALRAHLVDIDTHLPDIHPAKADSTGPAPIGSVATAGCAAGGGAGLVRARAAVAGLAHHQQAAAGAAARQRTTRRVRAAQLAHRHTAEHITPIAGPRQRAAGRGGPTQAMDVGRGAG